MKIISILLLTAVVIFAGYQIFKLVVDVRAKLAERKKNKTKKE